MGLTHKLEDLMNVPRLTEWLDRNLPELGSAPLEVALVHGGFSNVIISLNRGAETLMLRRPPAVPPPGAERTVLREARVLSALDKTDVPHPRCYASCDDAGVIGAPFYVMERVPGWSGKVIDQKMVHQPPFDRMPYEYGIPFAVVDAIARLANVDYKAVGLEGFGKPDHYLERQVDRWSSQLASYKEKYDYAGRDLPGYHLAEEWLRANIPEGSPPGIIHCDLGTPNMLFSDTPPVKVNALIDWELATIGDPLIDIAACCGGLRDERTPDAKPSSLHDTSQWPTRQELARYYAAGTGRDVSNLDYYVVLSKFKAGCIMEYKVAQAAKGILSKDVGEFFSAIVAECFEGAASLIKLIS